MNNKTLTAYLNLLTKYANVIQGPWNKKPPEQPDLLQTSVDIDDPTTIPFSIHTIDWDIPIEEYDEADENGYDLIPPTALTIDVPAALHPDLDPEGFKELVEKMFDEEVGFAVHSWKFEEIKD